MFVTRHSFSTGSMRRSSLKQCGPCIEHLERRRLLAATPAAVTATLGSDGILQVVGTKRADNISAGLGASGSDQLSVTSHEFPIATFPLASVIAIQISGGGGNDLLMFVPGLDIPVTILGEAGNDIIYGGGGDDSLSGGAGRDSLFGHGGDDLLRGDTGNDNLSGHLGDDNLDGGSGNDRLVGHEGNDFLTGGDGKDSLRGISGDDDLDGGSGNDELTGDEGNDRLRGGLGNDDLSGYDGDDDLNGGRGRDHIFGGTGIDDFDDNPSDRDLIKDRGPDENPGGDDQQIPPTDLPAAVASSFNSLFSAVTMGEVERETEDIGIIYKIDFFDASGIRGRATFDSSGQLLMRNIR